MVTEMDRTRRRNADRAHATRPWRLANAANLWGGGGWRPPRLRAARPDGMAHALAPFPDSVTLFCFSVVRVDCCCIAENATGFAKFCRPRETLTPSGKRRSARAHQRDFSSRSQSSSWRRVRLGSLQTLEAVRGLLEPVFRSPVLFRKGWHALRLASRPPRIQPSPLLR